MHIFGRPGLIESIISIAKNCLSNILHIDQCEKHYSDCCLGQSLKLFKRQRLVRFCHILFIQIDPKLYCFSKLTLCMPPLYVQSEMRVFDSLFVRNAVT